MNISIATGPSFPVPALQGGSVPRMWKGLAEAFVARGHHVTIFCRSYPGQARNETINGVAYERNGGFAQSSSISMDLLRDMAYATRLAPILPPADILVINDFWLPVLASLRRSTGRVVINVNRFPKGQFFLYRRAPRFTVPSAAILQALAIQCPSAAKRARVIPNAIDVHVFSPKVTSQRAQDHKTILYAGRIHPEKGLHLLLAAFAILTARASNIRLRILGPTNEAQGGGGPEYLRALKARAEGLNVLFSEPIFDPSELAAAFRSSDIFCYPSLAERGEALSVAPIEAMATGLVPVVSSLACFEQYVKDGKTGIVFDHRTPAAADNLAAALAAAIEHETDSDDISARAVKKAQEFSCERIAGLYLQEFEQLLNSRDL